MHRWIAKCRRLCITTFPSSICLVELYFLRFFHVVGSVKFVVD